jgi:MFS family permease
VRLLAVLALTALLYSASAAIVNLAAGLYILDITGSKVLLTITVAAYNVAFALSSLLLVGRGRRGSLPASIAAVAVSIALMYMSEQPWTIILLNGVYGFFAAFIQPAIVSSASKAVGEAEAVPRINIASSIGVAAGDLLAAMVSQQLTARGLLVLSASIAAAAFPLSLKASRMEQLKVPGIASAPLVTGRARYSPPTTPAGRESSQGNLLPLTFYLGVLAFFTGVSIFFSPMPAYLREVGFTDSQIYMLSMTALVTSTLLYELLRRLRLTVIQASKFTIVTAASRVAIFLAPLLAFHGVVSPTKLIPTVYVFVGATWALISTAIPIIALRLGGGEQGLGRVNAMTSIGLVAGSLTAAPLTAAGSWDATCPAAAATMALAAILYYIAYRGIARQAQL